MNGDYAALAFGAGAVIAFQVVLNSRLAGYVGDPMRATLVSFAIGTVAALAYCLIVRPGGWQVTGERPPWWAFCGGLLGLLYIATSVIVGPKIGFGYLVAWNVAGQVLTTTLIDHFALLGSPHEPINWPKALGSLFVVAGVTLIAWGKALPT